MANNKFATGQIQKKPVEVVKGRISAGRDQSSPDRTLIDSPCIVGYDLGSDSM
jgi:hypothetical protein